MFWQLYILLKKVNQQRTEPDNQCLASVIYYHL